MDAAVNFEDDQFLTIGSLVSIFVPGSHGFITADRFHPQQRGTERLCGVDNKTWKEANFRTAAQLDPQDLRPPGDFMHFVFQVRHQHQYSAQRRLAAQMSTDPFAHESGRVPHSLAVDCEHERRLNAAEFEGACGTPIKYGDIIQLAQPMGRRELHPAAEEQECLGLLRVPAECNEECGRAVLSAMIGEDSWLRVLPALRTHTTGDRLRVHKFGDVVMGSDPIVLEGVSSRLTLHVEPSLAFSDGDLEVNGSLLGVSPVKFVIYRPYTKLTSDAVLCGQTIGLRAAQLDRGPYLQTGSAQGGTEDVQARELQCLRRVGARDGSHLEAR